MCNLTITLINVKIFSEIEVYSRIHELQGCALRALERFRMVTKEEAQEAIQQYKKKNPKKAKPRRKVNKLFF